MMKLSYIRLSHRFLLSIALNTCAVLFLHSLFARAQIPTRENPESTKNSVPSAFSFESFQKDLQQKNSSKRAKKLKLAYESLKKEDFPKAIATSSSLLEDSQYYDYSHWISAIAYRSRADKAIDKKDFSHAAEWAKKSISLLLGIEQKTPYSPLLKSLSKELGQSELILARALYFIKKKTLAKESFENGLLRLQIHNSLLLSGDKNLIVYGEICHKNWDELCQAWFQKIANTFPKKSNEITSLLKLIPDLYEKVKYSKPLFSKITQSYKSPDLDSVAFDAAMKIYFDKDYGKAIKNFRLFLDDYPRSPFRFRIRYWLAQALEQEKEKEKSQKVYQEILQESPLSFYGYLAAQATGQTLESQLKEDMPALSETDPALSAFDIIHLKRAKSFVAEKLYDLAAIELKEIKPRDHLSSPFLFYLALLNYQAKSYNTEFILLSELLLRGYEGMNSQFCLKLIFPVEFMEIISKFSQEHELDPILVLSLIKQESAFDEDAGSNAGAMGLMQIMPATALETTSGSQATDLLIAEKNIAIGTKYLKKLLTRYKGNIVLALAGYNAGPNAVDRWLKDASAKKGMLEFIESIPYKETREYVGSIIRNYYWYSRMISSQDSKLQNFKPSLSPKGLDYFWTDPALINNSSPSPKPQNGNA